MTSEILNSFSYRFSVHSLDFEANKLDLPYTKMQLTLKFNFIYTNMLVTKNKNA